MNNIVPKGYKYTKVGVIPEDWDVVKLGEVLTIGSGKDYKHLKTGNIPVYGTGGYMLSVDKYLYDGESLCIGRKGTIDKPMLLNGKFWTVDTLFYTHSYINSIPKFLYSSFLRINWKKYNEASGVPSLSKSTIETISISLPPIKEQEKIANILTTWDDAISKQDELIKAKEELKKGLMQKLLSGEVRFDGFFDEWIKMEFELIFNRIASKKYQINSSQYLENGKYPVIDQGKKKIVAYADDTEKLFRNKSIILFGDHTRVVKYIDFNFIVGADGTQLITTKENFDNKFFYYQLLNKRVPNTGYNRHFKFIKDMIFRLPSLQEQEKIAEVLTNADKEIDLLKNEFQELKEQKKGLMQKLLTGVVRVRV